MAAGGAVFRLANGHDNDSGQTADIVQFTHFDEERDYNRMLDLCTPASALCPLRQCQWTAAKIETLRAYLNALC
jgi:hypothetical protein